MLQRFWKNKITRWLSLSKPPKNPKAGFRAASPRRRGREQAQARLANASEGKERFATEFCFRFQSSGKQNIAFPTDFPIVITFALLAFILLFFFSVFAGTKALSFSDAMCSVFGGAQLSESAKVIIKQIRFPRTIAVVLCGAAFSVSGLVLQSSLNNTLASPGILGINSGAGFFVLLASLFFPYSGIVKSAAAFLGALLAVLIVYAISRKAGVSKTTLILSGVAVSSLMTAGIDIVITIHPEIVQDKVAFSLGGFQNFSIQSVKIAFPLIVAGIAALLFLSSGIDLFALGDETAYGLGLNVKVWRVSSIIIAGLLAGAAVSISGLLGFMGLIVPNIVRIFWKNKTIKNILLCIIFGADFLLLCDILSRVLFFPYELPVGLLLSCLGSPFFVFMLIRRKNRK